MTTRRNRDIHRKKREQRRRGRSQLYAQRDAVPPWRLDKCFER